MSEINKEILDNEEITVSNENNEQVDITSDQIINLENSVMLIIILFPLILFLINLQLK